MVKAPVNVRSLKSTTIKVEPSSASEVSTANWSPQATGWLVAKVVRTALKPIYVRSEDPVDLSSVNRALRGRHDPVVNVTGDAEERATA